MLTTTVPDLQDVDFLPGLVDLEVEVTPALGEKYALQVRTSGRRKRRPHAATRFQLFDRFEEFERERARVVTVLAPSRVDSFRGARSSFRDERLHGFAASLRANKPASSNSPRVNSAALSSTAASSSARSSALIASSSETSTSTLAPSDSSTGSSSTI